MKWIPLLFVFAAVQVVPPAAEPGESAPRIWVLPIRQDIDEPLLYTVRRGVKEAIADHADTLILDMETNGGRVDSMLKIIDAIQEFKGRTITYVNKTAFSAGAMIAMATDDIYMSPESVIGAAAPIMLSPGGGGVESMPDTVEKKMTSAISGKIRAFAQKHGHNTKVVEAMINKSSGLKMGEQVIIKEGELLTLTASEAEKKYGSPPAALLSKGTLTDLPALYQAIGASDAAVTRVKETGAEKLAGWIVSLRAILLMVGIVGIYIEVKTPGVVLPGVIGGMAIAIYFFGAYVAGLSGLEWLALFLVGLAMVLIELFVTPGTVAVGVIGGVAMLVALVMAMVDLYPGGPILPTMPQLELPIRDMSIAMVGALVCAALLVRILPKTQLYGALVSHSISGGGSMATVSGEARRLEGRKGVTVSTLRPSGKAQFGDEVIDVISEGDMVESGQPVRVVGTRGRTAVVRVVEDEG